MRKNYNYPDKSYNVKCSICGNIFSVKYNTWRQKRNYKEWKCSDCMKIVRAKLLNERINDNSKEKEKLKDARLNYWNSLSDEEKEKRKEKITHARNNYFNNLSQEEKENLRKNQSEKMKNRWNSLSDEEKNKYRQRTIDQWNKLSDDEKKQFALNTSLRWKSFSEEKKANIIAKIKETNNKKSKEEKEEINKKHSESSKAYWDSLSDEEKYLYSVRAKENYNNGYIKWWNNLSQEEKENWSDKKKERWSNLSDEERSKIINSLNSYFNNLSNDEKKEFIRKRFQSIKSTNNNFNKKFEEIFNNSILISYYYLKSEEVLVNNDIVHSWDYGIYLFNDNSLQMVVDLDGEYFHADYCDYDGFHSKEEYDEKRSLSVPDGIKSFIIQEGNLKKCFELMMKQLMMNYDEYIHSIFDMCRMIPFPYPNYMDNELLKSFKGLQKMRCDDKYHQDISLNTRIGDRIIQHFHQSIYHARTKGNISPYKAWYDDELLMKCIENRVIYQSYLNPNKILQGFNISKISPKVSVFSAGRAKMIINKYLSEFDEVFDPFSGFSGRMLGAVSLGKKYIGYDINEIHVRESNEIINHFNLSAKIVQLNILSIDFYESYECLFTCPPYGDKEEWINQNTENKSCDEWIDICLEHFKCKKYVFVVDETKKYQHNIHDVIMNKSHFGSNNEFIVVIE